jgi:hypothetical protein
LTRLVRLRWVWAATTLLITLAACGSGLSQSQAIEIASEHVPADAHVTSVRSGTFGQFAGQGDLPEVARDRLVWAVAFTRGYQGECVISPDAQHCPPNATAMVVIDFFNGEFVTSEMPAP